MCSSDLAFDPHDLLRARRLAAQARDATDVQAAMELYRQAVQADPADWYQLVEAARVALDAGGAAELALAMSAQALQRNPWFSPELWCVHGDALRSLDRPAEARAAYQRGLAASPRHVRLLWSLARVATETGRFEDAFRLLGEALACDRTGDGRGDCLQLLDVALRRHALALEVERGLSAARPA